MSDEAHQSMALGRDDPLAVLAQIDARAQRTAAALAGTDRDTDATARHSWLELLADCEQIAI